MKKFEVNKDLYLINEPYVSEDDDSVADFEVNRGSDLAVLMEPKDRFGFVYATFYILGILTLLPWNFFVTANDYWMFKFRNLNQNQSDIGKSELQSLFTSYISMAATGPSVIFLFLNALVGSRLAVNSRIVLCMTLILASFLTTTAFARIDTDLWQRVFFIVTIATVIIINVCSVLLQASLWSLSSKFPSSYTSALISGQALGGVFSTVVYILSLLSGASTTMSALLYFNIANVSVVLTLVSFHFISKTDFFIYHTTINNFGNLLQHDPTDMDDIVVLPEHTPKRHWKQIFNQVKQDGLSVFFCFTVTLAAFPGLMVLIVSSEGDKVWRDTYFVPVVSFLVYNICDFLGRISSEYSAPLLHKNIFIKALSLTRMILIPLMLLCNLQPRNHVPAIFLNDIYFIIITCSLAFTNGFIINSAFINVKRGITDTLEQEDSFAIMAIWVGLGCAIGSMLNFLIIKFL